MTTVPDLGVGIGLRVPHLRAILGDRDHAGPDFFELISENFMVDGGPPLRNLDAVAERWPVVLHGVSMGLGSSDPLDRDHLDALVALARRTRAPWVSEHLCWTRHGNAHLHDLLPLPYTEAVADFVAAKAAYVQDRLGVPFALENLSSYVGFRQSEMPEWAFLRRVVERADCHVMLDVNNIWVSSVNHGFDPWDYLAAVPWERVVQVHVAGHSVREDGTLWDTHDHPVCDEVWALYAHACQQVAASGGGSVSTLLEWDDALPSYAETLAEAAKARRYRAAALAPRPVAAGRASPEPLAPPGLSRLQAGFSTSITTPLIIEADGHRPDVEHYDPDTVADMLPGPCIGPVARLSVYNRQYWYRLLSLAQDELPLTRHLLGVETLNRVVMAYLQEHPSAHPGLQHLLDRLPRFLSHARQLPAGWRSTLVQQAVAVDLAWQRVFFAAEHDVLAAHRLSAQELTQLLDASLPLQPALALVAEDWNLVSLRPAALADPDDAVTLHPVPGQAWWALHRGPQGFAAEPLTRGQHAVLSALASGASLPNALAGVAPVDLPALAADIQGTFARWAALGWFVAPR